MTDNRRFLWAATAVLLLAALFRLLAFQDVPPGLSQDEVLNADVVSFIRGGTHTFFFREGYGHEPLYHYWAVPFQVLLGDNVLSIRLPAMALGMFLVALTMRWAKREFGGAKAVFTAQNAQVKNYPCLTAVVTGIGLAISWWPIIFSRIGLRPIMEPVLLVLMAWFWPKRPFVAGLFLGLSLYSYTGARVVFLIPVLIILHWLLVGRCATPNFPSRFSPRFSPVKAGLIMLMVALVVSLPLFLTLRADPSLQQRVDQLAGPLDALWAGDPLPVLKTTLATLGVFGVTGDPRWTYTLPNRPLFDPITAVFFLTGLGITVWRWRQQRYAFVLIWLLVGLIPSAVTPQAPSTVRLVGAMPLIYLMPGLAVAEIYQRWVAVSDAGQKRRRLALFGTLLLAGMLLNVGRTVQDGFVRWSQAEETRGQHYQTVLLEMSRHFDATPEKKPIVIADGFFEPVDRDSFRRNLGYDPEARWVQTGSEVAGAIVIPAGGENACTEPFGKLKTGGCRTCTERCRSGRFYVPEFAAPDADLLNIAGIPAEPLYRSEERPSFAVYELPAEFETKSVSPAVSFSDQISLMGYETLPVTEDGVFTLFTVWQVERPLPADLAIFVHLVDENGDLIDQHDGLDAAPQTLIPGDVLIQQHHLQWPESVEADPLEIRIGLYQRTDGLRWQPAGQPADVYTIPLPAFDD